MRSHDLVRLRDFADFFEVFVGALTSLLARQSRCCPQVFERAAGENSEAEKHRRAARPVPYSYDVRESF